VLSRVTGRCGGVLLLDAAADVSLGNAPLISVSCRACVSSRSVHLSVSTCKDLLHPLVQVPDPDGSGDMVQGEAVSVGRSVLAVFQRGQQIWSSAATAQAIGLLRGTSAFHPKIDVQLCICGVIACGSHGLTATAHQTHGLAFAGRSDWLQGGHST
jgi:hypothetical protein